MRVTFFWVAKRKSPKKRRPRCLRPRRCAPGQPAVLGFGGVSLELASLRQSRALIRQTLRSSAHTEGRGSGHPFGPLLRSAPFRGRRRLALGVADAGSSAATTRVAVRLFGPHPLLAAPAPGRLRGGSRASARLLRDLTRRGCPSGAAQQHSEFRGAPRNRTGAGLPLRTAKGSQTEGRLFFAYFLLASQKKVTPLPGDSRLPP